MTFHQVTAEASAAGGAHSNEGGWATAGGDWAGAASQAAPADPPGAAGGGPADASKRLFESYAAPAAPRAAATPLQPPPELLRGHIPNDAIFDSIEMGPLVDALEGLDWHGD